MLAKLFRRFRRRPLPIVVYKNGKAYRVKTIAEAYALMAK